MSREEPEKEPGPDSIGVEIIGLPSPDALTGEMRDLLAYWLAKRGDRPMPLRRDIDPTEITQLLPSIVMVDVLAKAPFFRYRLVGTRQVRARGVDPTGRDVETHHMGQGIIGMRDRVVGNYQTVRDTGKPLFADRAVLGAGRTDYTVLSGRMRTLCSLFLPLSKDGAQVDVILGYSDIEQY